MRKCARGARGERRLDPAFHRRRNEPATSRLLDDVDDQPLPPSPPPPPLRPLSFPSQVAPARRSVSVRAAVKQVRRSTPRGVRLGSRARKAPRAEGPIRRELSSSLAAKRGERREEASLSRRQNSPSNLCFSSRRGALSACPSTAERHLTTSATFSRRWIA